MIYTLVIVLAILAFVSAGEGPKYKRVERDEEPFAMIPSVINPVSSVMDPERTEERRKRKGKKKYSFSFFF